MTEYFDVVGQYDQPTGERTTKLEAHKLGILHRVVAIYVFDRQGNLYVQDHKVSGLLDHSVGGHVSAGEDYLMAAQREGNEELGLNGQRMTSVFASLYSDERFHPKSQIVHQFGIFECQPTAGWKFVPNDEVETIIPMKLGDVVHQMSKAPTTFTLGFINTMSKYIEVKQLPFELDVTHCRAAWEEKDS